MKRGLLLVLVLALGVVGGCRRPARNQTAGKPQVVVSILPLKSLAERVGDGRVSVSVLVPPGVSPHTFEPRPQDVEMLQHARLVVFVGLGLEHPWGERLLKSAGVPPEAVVYLARGITPTPDSNPHVWLSPRNGRRMVQNLAEALARTDPSHADLYRTRAQAVIRALDSLDAVYRERFSRLQQRAFVATHAAWVYLARDYGLDQAAVLQHKPGEEPSARQVAEILRVMRQRGIRVIVVEPQLPEKAAWVLARETGARIVRLDPLGVATGHTDYLDLLAYNLETLWKALAGEGSPEPADTTAGKEADHG